MSSPVHFGSSAPAAASPSGSNVASEFRVLLESCGVYDLTSRAKIALTGNDRVRWLNGMITNNVRDLAVNHGVYGFLLNPQGRILGDLYVYNHGDSLAVETDESQLARILGIFDRYIIMDDVEVANLNGKSGAIGVAGPKSREIVKRSGIELAELDSLQFAEISWNDIPILIVRGDNPALESYEFWLEPGNASILQNALIEAGAKPVGPGAIGLIRIASGIPHYGQDIRERDLPQETEQKRALHFSKGCYVGQEIVERIRSRGSVHRKFTGFAVEGRLPSLGTKIEATGKEVGEITSSATLPIVAGGRSVALGYIRREIEKTGIVLNADHARLTIVNLPFSDVFSN